MELHPRSQFVLLCFISGISEYKHPSIPTPYDKQVRQFLPVHVGRTPIFTQPDPEQIF